MVPKYFLDHRGKVLFSHVTEIIVPVFIASWVKIAMRARVSSTSDICDPHIETFLVELGGDDGLFLITAVEPGEAV